MAAPWPPCLPDVQALARPGLRSRCADAITALVLDGRIATETRLPTERDLAAALPLSRATVTAAYDALRADGYLASRTGSGSYVSVPGRLAPAGLPGAVDVDATGRRRDRPVLRGAARAARAAASPSSPRRPDASPR